MLKQQEDQNPIKMVGRRSGDAFYINQYHLKCHAKYTLFDLHPIVPIDEWANAGIHF